MNKFVAVLGFVLVANCGGGGSGFRPSVTGSKPLGQLSDADAKTLCKDTITYFTAQIASPAFVETECRALGVAFASLSSSPTSTDAQLQAACQAGYALCKASPPDAGAPVTADGGAPGTACDGAMMPPATCTATVDQYSACVNEEFAALQNAYPACNQLTKATVASFGNPDAGTTLTSGPACAAFEAACPGVAVNPTTGALTAARR